MKRLIATIYVTFAVFLGSEGASAQANRIPITASTQNTCYWATDNNGRWDTLNFGREVARSRDNGFTELECARHLVDGPDYTAQTGRGAGLPRRENYARLQREQDPAAVARAAEERATQLEAAARRATADKKTAAEAAARQAKIEAARLRKLSAEAREADARARAADADANARVEAARKTASREREANLGRLEAGRREAETKAELQAIRLKNVRRERLSGLTVGLRAQNILMEVATRSAIMRSLPERGSKTISRLTKGDQVHVVGDLPSGWVQVAEEGEPVGWVYRASLREGRRSGGEKQVSLPSGGPSSAGSSSPLYATNYPFPSGTQNPNAVAVLIGNKNYRNGDIPSVLYAHNDLEVMRQFVIKTLGYREGNVFVLRDASKAGFEAYFGNQNNHRGRVFDMVRKGMSDVFVYVSGHGVPGNDKDGYLLPVDGDPGKVNLTGYNVRTLVENMNKVPARTITIALDTCFSGISQGGNLIKATSGIYIRPKFTSLGKVTLLTAATGSQTSSWDTGARLGLFTRHFIEGMLGRADVDGGNGNGSIELAELKSYVASRVTYQARRRYSRDQTPEVLGPLDRMMTKVLAPEFSFGDPNLVTPLPREGQREGAAPAPPTNRTDQRGDDDSGSVSGLFNRFLNDSSNNQNENNHQTYND